MRLEDIVTQVPHADGTPVATAAPTPATVERPVGRDRRPWQKKKRRGLFSRCCGAAEEAEEQPGPRARKGEPVATELTAVEREEVAQEYKVEPPKPAPPPGLAPNGVYACLGPYAPPARALLPPPEQRFYGKKLLVLDLDETLVHSSFNYVTNSDILVDIDIDDPNTGDVMNARIYVYKRPYVDEFLQAMAQHYELCVFTASLRVYCDAVMDQLDPQHLVSHCLYRESCTNSNGVFVKDLSRLGRPLESIIILDNNHVSFLFHPQNGILAEAFYDDKTDDYLQRITGDLIHLSTVPDVREYLARDE